MVERAGAPDEVLEQIVEFGLERRVFLRLAILFFEIEDQRHQRFGDIAPTEPAEMTGIVRQCAQAVYGRLGSHNPGAWQRRAVKSRGFAR
ncbi:hypothetical protein GCM10011494_37470 [Novosphingobium endophyticum]|uniref:Uncharacterized protein n=1 Tax=Novosphingobium endophyticum TaxID=1955250 RepID=A0A916X669_9SPHN|nr:hypothetical protein GCM10011494_37470 [Novosphingobium endophyticum]